MKKSIISLDLGQGLWPGVFDGVGGIGRRPLNSIENVVDVLAPLICDYYFQHFAARERCRLHAVSLKNDLAAICNTFGPSESPQGCLP